MATRRKDRAEKWWTPLGVYMTTDGGEWCLRQMANGVHVIGPQTCDSMGYWPTYPEAKAKLVAMAGDGAWDVWQEPQCSQCGQFLSNHERHGCGAFVSGEST
jgi:hypothetical protein